MSINNRDSCQVPLAVGVGHPVYSVDYDNANNKSIVHTIHNHIDSAMGGPVAVGIVLSIHTIDNDNAISESTTNTIHVRVNIGWPSVPCMQIRSRNHSP